MRRRRGRGEKKEGMVESSPTQKRYAPGSIPEVLSDGGGSSEQDPQQLRHGNDGEPCAVRYESAAGSSFQGNVRVGEALASFRSSVVWTASATAERGAAASGFTQLARELAWALVRARTRANETKKNARPRDHELCVQAQDTVQSHKHHTEKLFGNIQSVIGAHQVEVAELTDAISRHAAVELKNKQRRTIQDYGKHSPAF
ncbi:hypothetical protein DFH06DRAFT_1411264 [Mycena polygramma]|nr:hypothetical protein DFH06DRAFT_1411264 [Mycena polygramma]